MRRPFGWALVILAVAAVVVAIAAVVARPDSTEPAAGPAAVPTPTLGGDGRVVLAYAGVLTPSGRQSLVLDMATGEYEPMPYDTVTPSPDGSRLFVTWDWESGTIQSGILDPATGELAPLRLGGRDPQWSSDGSMVVFTNQTRDGFVVVEAATAIETAVPVRELWASNPLGLNFSLTSDETGVLLVTGENVGGEAGYVRLTGINRYSLTGELVSTVPLAVEHVRWAVVSADGSRVLAGLIPEPRVFQIAVISASDGSLLSTLSVGISAPVRWANSEIAVSFVGEVFRLEDGEIITHLETPSGLGSYEDLVVGPAAGLPASAAHLAF